MHWLYWLTVSFCLSSRPRGTGTHEAFDKARAISNETLWKVYPEYPDDPTLSCYLNGAGELLCAPDELLKDNVTSDDSF